MASARALGGLAIAAALGVVLASCSRRPADDNAADNGQTVTIDVPRAAAGSDVGVTPMAERVAVLGFLNKRNGIVRDLTLRPGQAIRIKDVTVRLRACETAAPWENAPLTGAFVQLDVERSDGKWIRVFSGWLYKESPSLNVVEHPVYDVWPKSCAMNFPAGPAAPSSPRASSNASSAKKSAPDAGAAAVAGPVAETPPPEPIVPVPSASPSNAT